MSCFSFFCLLTFAFWFPAKLHSFFGGDKSNVLNNALWNLLHHEFKNDPVFSWCARIIGSGGTCGAGLLWLSSFAILLIKSEIRFLPLTLATLRSMVSAEFWLDFVSEISAIISHFREMRRGSPLTHCYGLFEAIEGPKFATVRLTSSWSFLFRRVTFYDGRFWSKVNT